MTGFGFGSLYGADPGLPYYDPTQTNALGLPVPAPTPMAAAVASPSPGFVTVGDSIAAGMAQHQKNDPSQYDVNSNPESQENTSLYAASGRNTKQVLDTINANQDAWNGKNVMLSSGWTNDTANPAFNGKSLSYTDAQIRALKDAGANVALMGVGNGVQDHNEINQQLAGLAKAYNIPFSGELATTRGVWHPRDYGQVLNQFPSGWGSSAASAPRAPSAYDGASLSPETVRATGNPIADYIIKGAIARGIDPNEALHTVDTEGGLGAFKIGDKTQMGSGGPFQLNMLPGSLGDSMLKQTGKNPLDPKNLYAGIDYALDYVQNHGGHFSPDIWHGLRIYPYKGQTVNIPQYASAGGSDSQESTGTMDSDTAVDTTGLPGLGSLRQIAANAMIDPSKLQNPATSMMLQKLMQNPNTARLMAGGGNPSATLARMSAGFFGGRGPAQSLAGGFKGLADSETADQAQRASLLGSLLNNQNDLYKMGIQNNMGINRSLLTAAALMPSRGMQLAGMLSRSGLPPGTAMTVAGVLPKGDPRAAEADAAYKTENPLPAAAQAQQSKLLDNVNNQRVFENQISPYIDAVKSGSLPLTGAKIAEYNTRNSTWGRYIGMPPTPQSTMYNQLKAILSQRQLDVASGLKGATTDKDLEVSMNTLMGNGAQNNAESLLPHLTALKARAALDEQNGIKRVNQFRTDQRKTPLDIDSNVSAPASDFSNLPGSQLSKLLVANGQPLAAPGAAPPAIGGGTPPVGAAPSVGAGAGGVGQIKLPSGSTLSY